MAEGNGWGRYEQRVLGEITDLKSALREVRDELSKLRRDEISDLKVQVAMLKVKSGLWGAAAGFIPAAIVVLLQLASS